MVVGQLNKCNSTRANFTKYLILLICCWQNLCGHRHVVRNIDNNWFHAVYWWRALGWISSFPDIVGRRFTNFHSSCLEFLYEPSEAILLGQVNDRLVRGVLSFRELIVTCDMYSICIIFVPTITFFIRSRGSAGS